MSRSTPAARATSWAGIAPARATLTRSPRTTTSVEARPPGQLPSSTNKPPVGDGGGERLPHLDGRGGRRSAGRVGAGGGQRLSRKSRASSAAGEGPGNRTATVPSRVRRRSTSDAAVSAIVNGPGQNASARRSARGGTRLDQRLPRRAPRQQDRNPLVGATRLELEQAVDSVDATHVHEQTEERLGRRGHHAAVLEHRQRVVESRAIGHVPPSARAPMSSRICRPAKWICSAAR